MTFDTSSSKTGWAIFDGAIYRTHGLIDLDKEKDSEKRTKDMCLEITRLLNTHKPGIVVVEKMNVSRNMNVVRTLCKIIDCLYYYSILNPNIDYHEMQASTWRGLLDMQKPGRKRDEYKELSVQYIKDRLKMDVTDDESDALCIGYAYIKQFENLE